MDGALGGVVAGHHGEEPESLGPPVDPGGVLDPMPQHLEATTDTEHRRSGLRGEDEGLGHPGAMQPVQVAGHLLGTGEDDQVGAAQVVDGSHPGDPGDLLQWDELVEVRRVGATDD